MYEFQDESDGSNPLGVIMTRNGVIYGIASDEDTNVRLGGSTFALQP